MMIKQEKTISNCVVHKENEAKTEDIAFFIDISKDCHQNDHVREFLRKIYAHYLLAIT